MNLSFAVLSSRIECCEKYLVAVGARLNHADDWGKDYEAYLNGRLCLVESLALIHPEFYKDFYGGSEVRGARDFAQEIPSAANRCQAERVWGYTCPLDYPLAADHLFPWSWGGPSDPANKIFLCRLHNQMKSNDVHLFPWEDGEPAWLKRRLRSISGLLT